MIKNKTVITIFICCTVSVFWSCVSSGSPAKTLFFQAEACHQELQNSPDKQKYRVYWFNCIKKFKSAYQQDPSGPWAAAGLFNMGRLYEELYSHSYKKEDREEAEKIYRQIIRDFPASAYKQRSQSAIKNLPDFNRDSEDTEAVKKTFFEAESCYTELLAHPNKEKYRSYWMEPINKFESVYQQDPSGPWAAAGLYMMGNLYEDLYKHSYKKEDKQKAKEIFEKIVHQYPDSAYCEKAENRLGGDIKKLISEDTVEKLPTPSAVGKKEDHDAAPSPENKEPDFTTVTDIRYWSNPEYTRVVIDTDRATTFQNNLLKKDPAIDQSHQRLYIDLKNSRLGCIKKNDSNQRQSAQGGPCRSIYTGYRTRSHRH